MWLNSLGNCYGALFRGVDPGEGEFGNFEDDDDEFAAVNDEDWEQIQNALFGLWLQILDGIYFIEF